MVIAFVLHIVTTFALLPFLEFLYLDAGTFHWMTVQLLEGQFPSFATGVDAFIGLQAILYLLFQPDIRVVSIFNSLFAVLLVIPVRRIADELYDRDIPQLDLLTLSILFLPVPFIQLTLPLRDTVGLLCFFTALLFASKAIKGDPFWWLLSIPIIGASFLIRSELILLMLVGLAASFTINHAKFRQAALLSSPLMLVSFYLFANRYPLHRLNVIVQARASGRAAYLESFTYSSWLDAVISAPVRGIHFLYAPFPLHITAGIDVLLFFVLIMLVILTIGAGRSVLRRNPNVAITILLGSIFLGGIVGYGLIDSNYGTTIRHRVPFVFLLAVFSAPMLDTWGHSLSSWLRQRPDHYRGKKEQDREAEKLNAGVNIHQKDPDRTR